MPRKSTSTTAKIASTLTSPPAKASTRAVKRPSAADALKPKHPYEVLIFTNNGKESLWFDEKRTLERFIVNVTKRNLQVAALEITDATGSLFIIRGFEFAKVIHHKA